MGMHRSTEKSSLSRICSGCRHVLIPDKLCPYSLVALMRATAVGPIQESSYCLGGLVHYFSVCLLCVFVLFNS